MYSKAKMWLEWQADGNFQQTLHCNNKKRGCVCSSFPEQTASSVALKCYWKVTFCGLFCLAWRARMALTCLVRKLMKMILACGRPGDHLGKRTILELQHHLSHSEWNAQCGSQDHGICYCRLYPLWSSSLWSSYTHHARDSLYLAAFFCEQTLHVLI